MRAQVGRNPKYQKRSEEDKDSITAGIYQNYDRPTKERLRREHAGKDKSLMNAKTFAYLLGFGSGRGLWHKDFGGWTSHNSDWERGFREGERKTEDRQRGIHTQRDRAAQFNKKEAELKAVAQEVQTIDWTTDPDDDVRQMQKEERQEGLRYRAGEGKEQHQGVGKVPAAPGSPTRPKIIANPKVKFFRSTHSVLYVPIDVRVCTKSFGGAQRGDLIVEGIVSMPIKDLQGDVIELPALVKAKNEMVTAPHNLVWLDHESPYAKPQSNQETPPIGKFVLSKIIKLQGYPALWARMIVNKKHPDYDRVAYELKKGFYNAFSMEFVPLKEGLKMVGGKIANAIGDLKYFATSLVRAPANEPATVQTVYVKAFANSTRFCPVRVSYPGGVGQTIRQKGFEENLGKRTKELEPEEEPEEEPELEPEAEPEFEPEEEPAMDGMSGDGSAAPTDFRATPRKKDYDRQTGSTAAERSGTAIGEWGDPALDKARAKRKATIKDFIQDHDRRIDTIEAGMKTIIAQNALMGKALGLNLKGIDEDTTEVLGEENAGDYEDEQVPPETKPGKLKPDKQRMISTFKEGLGGTQDVEGQQVKSIADLSPVQLKQYVRGIVRKEADRMTVVRHGGFGVEEVGPVPESIKLKRLLDKDDGSIESQLEIYGM